MRADPVGGNADPRVAGVANEQLFQKCWDGSSAARIEYEPRAV